MNAKQLVDVKTVAHKIGAVARDFKPREVAVWVEGKSGYRNQ